ncbi:molybdopterin molybdotransferase MoeA [Kitasatospora sp. NPDC056138]|uniref:molybdopterin molybdotransferase MoeA n=1 Tax=Kitasatospora sp. NPDC056138 TaxID=3345724 RepID=UPI0035E00DBF
MRTGGGSDAGTAAAPLCHGGWPQARRAARLAVRGPLPEVTVELAEALGCTLAVPLAALTDLPAFDTSAMDGWAVAGPGPWHTSGRILAGDPVDLPAGPGAPAGPGGRAASDSGEGGPTGSPRTVLADGAAVEIATGAQVPAGATGVLRREHARIDRGLLYPRYDVAPGQDVRPRGQECRRGEPLLPAGTPVTAAVLGLAAACGHDRLAVRRRPTVELLLLGDELIDSGVPEGGLVRDALGPLLPPWLAASGAELVGCRRVGDDFALLRDAVRLSPADVVITTGGTAAGPVDFLHDALTAVGARLLVDGVAVRPGHPMLLAELPGGRRLVGLPGNPLAAVAGTVTLALPLLHALSGRPAEVPRLAVAARDFPGHPDDTRLLPVVRTEQGVVPLVFDGPAMLRGLALAEALAVVPPGGVRPGGRVELLAAP